MHLKTKKLYTNTEKKTYSRGIRMKNKGTVVVTLIVIFILISCTTKEPIKIGLSASLTGRNASLGLDVKDGVVFAIERINSKGGIKGRTIELIIKDDKNNPEQAQIVDLELINEGVCTIIGHVTSEITHSVINLMHENDMLLMSPTSSSKALAEEDDNMISLYPSGDGEQRQTVSYCTQVLEIDTVSIILDLDNKAFAENWKDIFVDLFEKSGGKIMDIVNFSSKQNPKFLELVKTALINKPQAVLIIASSIDTTQICQQLEKINPNVQKLSSGWAFGNVLLNQGGLSIQGLFLTNSWDNNSKVAEYISFKNDFQQRFNRNPGFAEFYGYETVMVLHQALWECRDISPLEIKEKILEISTFEGLQNKIVIGPQGNTIGSVSMFKVVNNNFVRVEIP